MSTEIDPRIVRDVAEAAFRSADDGSPAERVEAALIASGVAGPVLGEKFDAYSVAVGAEYERLVVRKVARTAMEMAATRRDDLDLAIRRHGGLGDMPEDPEAKAEYRKAYGALYSAAAADMKAGVIVAVSWSDEQQGDPFVMVAEDAPAGSGLIAENKGDDAIGDEDCVAAIEMIRAAVYATPEHAARMAEQGRPLDWRQPPIHYDFDIEEM